MTNAYVSSGTTSAGSLCRSPANSPVQLKQDAFRPHIVRGFSKDSISTCARSSMPGTATSTASEQYVYSWRHQHRPQSRSKSGCTSKSSATRCFQSSKDMKEMECYSSFDIDVFEDTDVEELMSDITSEISDEVDWDDIEEDGKTIDEEKFVFCRVATTSSSKSSASSLTSLIRQHSYQKESSPTTAVAIQLPAVLNFRACRQHFLAIELAGELSNHLRWENCINQDRQRASYQHLSCQTEATIEEGWHQALDSLNCYW